MATERPAAGHRTVPHTADVRIEAWAPSREGCVAQAVAALVGSFADVAGAGPVGTVAVRIEPAADEDLLAAALDEIIYLMDTDGRLPVGVEVRAGDRGGLDLDVRLADPGGVELIGAVPKAVSLHELRFERDADGWWCRVTVDV
jgi:SHS2 domain-containing protein